MPCPHCETSRFEALVIKAIEMFYEQGVLLTKMQARCFAVFLDGPGLKTTAALIHAMWHDEPTGAPLTAGRTVTVTISKLRKCIKAAGFQFVLRPVAESGYFLETPGDEKKPGFSTLPSVAVSLSMILLVGHSLMGFAS
jgi:DNA-binding response OmpR family regulator